MTARAQGTRSRLEPHRHWILGLACALLASGDPLAAAASPRGFLGYACRDDRCTSHKAGFDWAERNGIEESRACQARHDVAFTEGCRAYADEAVTPEQAGFRWARENDLADPGLCAGGGVAFAAGCEAYIRGLAD